jgi:hypothetical protein
MPKALPPEFRRDVVAVARKAGAPLRQRQGNFCGSGFHMACSGTLDLTRAQPLVPEYPCDLA